MASKERYHNKELSWLSFNYRVLLEARDETNPLFERIKFLSIYDSNLQEFCRNKLGVLKRIHPLTKEKYHSSQGDSIKVLKKVRATIAHHYLEAQDILYEDLLPALAREGIHFHSEGSLQTTNCMKELHAYFRIKLLAYLQPIILKGPKNNHIFLENVPYLLAKLTKQGVVAYGIVNIPSDQVARIYEVRCLDDHNLTTIDDVIRLNLAYLFKGYQIEEVASFRVIRNELIDIRDEYTGVLKEKIKEKLKDEYVHTPTNVIYDQSLTVESLSFLKKYFRFKTKDLLPGSRYHDLKDLIHLENSSKSILQLLKPAQIVYKPFSKYECIFKKIRQQDHLLYFPYHSYDHVLRFFNESAVDPMVREIRFTL